MKNRLTKIFMLIYTLILLLCFSLGAVACNEPEKEGKIYSLEKAYEDGLITREDLLNIAYYHGDAEHNPDEINDSFIPKELGELDEQTSLKIRTDLAEAHKKLETNKIEPNASNYKIIGFYGIYNGYIAFMYEADFAAVPTVETTKEIEGILLVYADAREIFLWKR